MNPTEQYIHDRDEQVRKNMKNDVLRHYTRKLTEELVRTQYTKNFTWMGIPILQFPTDLMVMQELICRIEPDYIIETGVAFGGMMVFYASMLECLQKGFVVGIDIDFRKHNWDTLTKHSLGSAMILLNGSSTSNEIVEQVKRIVEHGKVFISLDSNHTHDHVLKELRLYTPLVSLGSYIVVFDTSIEDFWHQDIRHQDRPWGIGNNPATAVKVFMEGNDEFVVDREIEQRALITSAPSGWLKRIKEAS